MTKKRNRIDDNRVATQSHCICIGGVAATPTAVTQKSKEEWDSHLLAQGQCPNIYNVETKPSVVPLEKKLKDCIFYFQFCT